MTGGIQNVKLDDWWEDLLVEYKLPSLLCKKHEYCSTHAAPYECIYNDDVPVAKLTSDWVFLFQTVLLLWLCFVFYVHNEIK